MARIQEPKGLQSTKVINGRAKVGDLVKHRNHPETSRINHIVKGMLSGVTIWLEDERHLDPLYCVIVKSSRR